MATFAELLDGVYTITNRRDLVAETIQAVKAATLQLHRKDNFFKDLREEAIEFTSAEYLQALDYRTLFPRYRSTKYIRKFDPTVASTLDQAGVYLRGIDPTQGLDGYGYTQEDVWYPAGAYIQIRSSTELQYILIGFYQNPDVSSEANYTSWIATELPYAIIYLAAANLFGSILKNKSGFDTNTQLAALEMQELIAANIEGEGR